MDYKIEICVSFEHLYFYTFILFSAHIDDFLGKQWSEGGECLHFHHHVDLLSAMECALGAWHLFTKHRLLAEQWA